MNIKMIIDNALDTALGNIYQVKGITTGDIYPFQALKWDECVSEIGELFEELIKQNYTSKYGIGIEEIEFAFNEEDVTMQHICKYVDMIESCLETIRDHDLLELVYGEFADKISELTTKDDLQEVLDCFCKPITDRACDTKIIIEDQRRIIATIIGDDDKQWNIYYNGKGKDLTGKRRGAKEENLECFAKDLKDAYEIVWQMYGNCAEWNLKWRD